MLFVTDLSSRQVHIADLAPIPNGPWMLQLARNLIDDFDSFLTDKRYLIHDRDSLFTREFRELLRLAGVRPLRLPPKPESERIRRAFRALDQVLVSQPLDHFRRALSSARDR